MTEARILKREPVFQGRVIDVALETVAMPSGQSAEGAARDHPPSRRCCRRALDEQDRVCLLRQFRHAADGWLWELPAGKIDPGETPRDRRPANWPRRPVTAEDWTDLGRCTARRGLHRDDPSLDGPRTHPPTACPRAGRADRDPLAAVGPGARLVQRRRDHGRQDPRRSLSRDAMIKSALEMLSEDAGC
jgi:hypothetical protein